MAKSVLHHRIEQDFAGVEDRRMGLALRQRRAGDGGEGVQAGQASRLSINVAGAGPRQFQREAAQMFGQPRAPLQHAACCPAAATA